MVALSFIWMTAIYLVLSLSFVYLGHMGQKAIGRANECKMTYSRPQQILVPVHTNIKEYRLYRHVQQGVKEETNAFPVLFLPGNNGS